MFYSTGLWFMGWPTANIIVCVVGIMPKEPRKLKLIDICRYCWLFCSATTLSLGKNASNSDNTSIRCTFLGSLGIITLTHTIIWAVGPPHGPRQVKPWLALACLGLPWLALACLGLPRLASACLGLPRLALAPWALQQHKQIILLVFVPSKRPTQLKQL
jgi:hypothetical protein